MSDVPKKPATAARSGEEFRTASAMMKAARAQRETHTGCPACRGRKRCPVCKAENVEGGLSFVFRMEPSGAYRRTRCPACIDGKCKLCNGDGIVRGSVASAWKMAQPKTD